MKRPLILAICLGLAATSVAGCDDDHSSDSTPDLAPSAPDGAAPTPDAAALTPDAAAPDAQPLDAEVDAEPVDYAIPDPPAVPPEPACDASQPPLIMAHGLLAAGDTWGPFVDRFAANGLCPERSLAFDWNTLDQGADHDGALEAFIDEAREALGVEQVDLMGHSAGGGLGYRFLADPARAAKVRRYVHVGSGANEAPAGPPDAPVPTLNVWSPDDLIVPGADIPGASNARLPGLDHYAVATDAAAFAAVYEFLYEDEPATLERLTAEAPVVWGRAVSLGENQPDVGATVDAWPVDAATGQRLGDAPVARWIVDADGRWGPLVAEPGVPYELHVRPSDGRLPVRYYRPPFTRRDRLVYLRTLPSPAGLAGVLLSQVPFDDAHTVLVVFSSTRAIIHPGDDLQLDGESVLDAELAAPEATLIALFVYDQGTDGMPGSTNPLFGMFPFLSMVDVPLAADAAGSVRVELGDQAVVVPRWPSGTEGATIVVLDPPPQGE